MGKTMTKYAEQQLLRNKIPSLRDAFEEMGITILTDDDIEEFIDGTPIDYDGYIITNVTKLKDLEL